MTYRNSLCKIKRVGQTFEKNPTVNKIGYESFSKKVLRFLNGDINNMHANDNQEYDEEEGSWTDDEPELDPMNAGDFDRIDAIDLEHSLIDKIETTEKKIKNVQKSMQKSKQKSDIQEKKVEENQPVVTEVK